MFKTSVFKNFFTMIRGDKDPTRVPPALFFEPIHQPTHLLVGEGDFGVVQTAQVFEFVFSQLQTFVAQFGQRLAFGDIDSAATAAIELLFEFAR